MALFMTTYIDGVQFLEPRSFNVTQTVQGELLTNRQQDLILIEPKGNNYTMSSISATWEAVDRTYADSIKDRLAASVLHTIVRNGKTYANMRLVSYQEEPTLRSRTKSTGVYYYNVTAEFEQLTSATIT